MTWLLLACLLLCSATVSGSETALFGLTRQDLHAFSRSTRPMRRRVAHLLQRPRHLLLTLLITNTAVNVGIFAVSFVTAEGLGETNPVAASLFGVGALVAVIAFGEILPKSIALAGARQLAPWIAPLIHVLGVALSPLRVILVVLLVEPATRLLRPQRDSAEVVSTDELRLLIESSTHQHLISSAENDMLQSVVSLADVSVRAVMVPRVDIQALSLHDSPGVIRERFARTHLTKLPVYGDDLDDIRGLLYAREFLLNPHEPVSRLVRPTDFIPEQANLVQVIRYFRDNHVQLAVVVDEYGGVAGLVTLEDVLQEIVGDLSDRAEAEGPPAEPLDANTYRLSGSLGVRAWAALFGEVPQEKQVDTLGGLITSRLGRLPRVGDEVRSGNLSLTVEAMRGRRVQRVLLRREPVAANGDGR